METLARLDLVKTNMGDCLHTLTEAASWNALVREVNARCAVPDSSFPLTWLSSFMICGAIPDQSILLYTLSEVRLQQRFRA